MYFKTTIQITLLFVKLHLYNLLTMETTHASLYDISYLCNCVRRKLYFRAKSDIN